MTPIRATIDTYERVQWPTNYSVVRLHKQRSKGTNKNNNKRIVTGDKLTTGEWFSDFLSNSRFIFWCCRYQTIQNRMPKCVFVICNVSGYRQCWADVKLHNLFCTWSRPKFTHVIFLATISYYSDRLEWKKRYNVQGSSFSPTSIQQICQGLNMSLHAKMLQVRDLNIHVLTFCIILSTCHSVSTSVSNYKLCFFSCLKMYPFCHWVDMLERSFSILLLSVTFGS